MPNASDQPYVPISARINQHDLAVCAIYFSTKTNIRTRSQLVNAVFAGMAEMARKLEDIEAINTTDRAIEVLHALGIKFAQSKQAQAQIDKAQLLESLEFEGYDPQDLEDIKVLLRDKRKRRALVKAQQAREDPENVSEEFLDHME
jgi:hypothetical protein